MDGSRVASIGSHLTDSGVEMQPKVLHSVPYGTKGTYVHGKGFVVSEEEFREFTSDGRNQECLRRYVVARDLMTHPEQIPSRWVVDFGDMSELQAREYPALFSHVVEYVKPQRDAVTGQIHETCFWKHWDRREELYEKIAGRGQVLVCPEVSKYCAFAFQPTSYLFSHMVNVVASEERSVFAVLSSDLHVTWAWHHGSTMRDAGLRYTTSSCLNTFPFPPKEPGRAGTIGGIGADYHEHRRELMLANNEGLTKTYNRFHDPEDKTPGIVRLRELHVEMDNAVREAYGWSDLDLEHGWLKTVTQTEKKNRKTGLKEAVEKVDWRYTISEQAKNEVLKRLLKLNHERYEEEVKQGLHDKKGKKKTGAKKEAKEKEASETEGCEKKPFKLSNPMDRKKGPKLL